MGDPGELKGRFGGLLASLVLLSALAVLLFAAALPEDRLLSLKDAGHLVLASKIRISEALRSQTLPLWNPSVGGGTPMLADPVFQVLYPGNLLLLLTSPVQSLKFFALLHLVLGGTAVLLLARQAGYSLAGGVAGALAFMGSGAIVSLHWNPPWMAGLPWLLFAILYTRRLLGRSGGWGSVAQLATSLALLLLSGAFEVVLAYLIYCAVEVAVFMLAGMLGRHPAGHPPWLRTIGLLTAAGGVATGLAAAQLLPSYEFLNFSHRAQGVMNLEASLWSLPPGRLLELLAPQLFGNPAAGTPWTALLHSSFANQPFFSGIYVGIPVLAIGLAGLVRVQHRDRWLLPGMLVVTAILALGDVTLLFGLARETIPLFGLFRYPAKILAISMIPLALLAAAGTSGLWERRPSVIRTAWWACLGLTAIVFGCWLAGHLFRDSLLAWMEAGIQREHLGINARTTWDHVMASLLRGLVPGLFLVGLLATLDRLPRRVFSTLLLLLLTLDLGLANRQLVATQAVEEFLAPPPQFPPPDLLKESSGITRIAQHPEHKVLLPHLISIYGLRCADGYGSMTVGNSLVFDAALKERPNFFLALKSVRFVVKQGQPDSSLEVSRLQNILPRALFVPRAAVAIDDQAVVRYLKQPLLDPRREILLSDAPLEAANWGHSNVRSEEARVVMLVDDAEELRLRVDTPALGYLFVNDTWYPGWEAWVNGHPTPIFRANLNFRAIQVPTGTSEVRLAYRPKSVRAGLQVSGLSLLLLGWVTSLAYRLPRQPAV